MKQKDQHVVILNSLVNYLKLQHKIHNDLLELDNPAVFDSYSKYIQSKTIKDFIDQLNDYVKKSHGYSILEDWLETLTIF